MIYLDFNATTPLDAAVAELYVDALQSLPGNASSLQHGAGHAASVAVDRARQQVADSLGVGPSSVVWTAGATESLFLATVGVISVQPADRRTIVISATEHKAALAAGDFCATFLGAEVRVVAPDALGVVTAASVGTLLDESVALVVTMHANNETGVMNPVPEIAEIAHHAGALILCDITQSIGKTDIRAVVDSADLLAFSFHKAYGPKGVGALVAEPSVRRSMASVLAGGGQEHGLRGGTYNAPAIAAAGLAMQRALGQEQQHSSSWSLLGSRLLGALASQNCRFEVIGEGAPRLTNTLNLRFPGVDAEALMAAMPSIAVSAGSACNSAVTEPSHVLTAMGLSPEAAQECIRISLGVPTTARDIDDAADAIVTAVRRLHARDRMAV